MEDLTSEDLTSPAGVSGQTLRFNVLNKLEASSLLKNDGTQILINDSGEAWITSPATVTIEDIDDEFTEYSALNLLVHNGPVQGEEFPALNIFNKDFDDVVFQVLKTGNIFSSPLQGEGDRILIADSNGVEIATNLTRFPEIYEIDEENDYLLLYSQSAGADRKIKPGLLTSPSSSAGLYDEKTVTITSPQLLDCWNGGTSWIEVIAAPGSGKMLDIDRIIYCTTGTTGYTMDSESQPCIALGYSPGYPGFLDALCDILISSLAMQRSLSVSLGVGDWENLALGIDNNSANQMTDGNLELTIRIIYREIEL